jgi:hypothetical protein
MLKPQILKRLDAIEVKLTPKEWAIRLADEIRRHPGEPEFLRALAKGAYRESPYVKPFLMLAKQAENRYPGQERENERARHKLSRALRMEYQALKSLINNISREVETKTDQGRLKIRALTGQLHGLISRAAVAGTIEKAGAWIEQCKTAETDEEERLLILKELANVRLVAGSRALLLSLAQDLADDAAMLFMELLVRKNAVEAVQRKYFDGHAILNHRVEGELEATIQLALETIATFNEYISTDAGGLSQQQPLSEDGKSPATVSEQRSCTLKVDVEVIRGRVSGLASCKASQWMTEAKNKATTDLLGETGEHEDFLWERFREEVGVKPLVQ